jgi:thiamine biosynthesis lipoprotein
MHGEVMNGAIRAVLSAWLVIGLTTGASRDDLARLERTDDVMGSTFSVLVHGGDPIALEAAAEAAFGEAHRLDRMLSNYQLDSEWSALNRHAAERPVRVSAELFDLLERCVGYSEESEGAFDITVGPLVRAWGFYQDEGRLPGAGQLSDAASRVGFRHVRLDRAARTVRFDRAGVELDPGGIGKGYAVDRMVDVLRRAGVRMALVSAAGSSMYAMGAPPGEPRGWRIPIRAPGDPQAAAAEVFLEDASLSTSGSYEKFFRAGGRVYSHIIDPRSGYPAGGVSSVSVIAPRTIDSEAWTKPYFINGRAWTAAHKPRGVRVFMCDDATPARCGWIE